MAVFRGGGCCFLELEKMDEGMAAVSAASSAEIILTPILLAVLDELAADMRNLLTGAVLPASPSCVLLVAWEALDWSGFAGMTLAAAVERKDMVAGKRELSHCYL